MCSNILNNNMEEVRRADPQFTNWECKTAVEAVERFCRLQRSGLNPSVIPEALIRCARGLSESELDKFEQWIVCPNDVGGISHSIIGDTNHKEHLKIVAEHGRIEEEVDEKSQEEHDD